MNNVKLYRAFLRAANSFDNYNFRSYFVRTVKTRFRSGEPMEEAAALKELQALRRQAAVSRMYHSDKLVVEKI